jgi:4-amino-4-deoxy-L-arabinose transferase-like glycosyltransferase
MEFKSDERTFHELALEQASGKMQLAGMMSSVAIHNPPMAVYLYAIPGIFTKNPVAFARFTALLDTAAILLAYFLARQWMSKAAALAAALLFAASPWAVLQSRKIWQPDLLPIFSATCLLCAVLWIRKGRWWQLAVAAAALSVASQLHYSGLTLVPCAAVVAWLGWRKDALRQWAVAAAVFAVLWVPFAVFLAREGGKEMARESVGTMSEYGYRVEFVRSVLWQARLMGKGGFDIVLGRSAGDPLIRAWQPQWLTVAVGVLLAGGLATTLARVRRRPDAVLLVLWVALPTVLLPFHLAFFHYFIISWPATFVMAGMLVDSAGGWSAGGTPRHWRAAAGMALVVAVIVSAAAEVVFTQRLFDLVSAQGALLGDYGSTYRDKLLVAKFVKATSGDGDFVLMDYSSPKRSDDTFEYLYRMEGGKGRLVPRPAPGQAHTTPVYAVLGPDIKGKLEATGGGQRDGGVFDVGALRVQVFWPAAGH